MEETRTKLDKDKSKIVAVYLPVIKTQPSRKLNHSLG